MLRWRSQESSRLLILRVAGRSLVVQCLGLGSPTLEAQARHLAEAPKSCWPHGLEEKEEINKKQK